MLSRHGWSARCCVPHRRYQFALNISVGLGLGGNESQFDAFPRSAASPTTARSKTASSACPTSPASASRRKPALYRVMRRLAEGAPLSARSGDGQFAKIKIFASAREVCGSGFRNRNYAADGCGRTIKGWHASARCLCGACRSPICLSTATNQTKSRQSCTEENYRSRLRDTIGSRRVTNART
jgi:hypothetical protein